MLRILGRLGCSWFDMFLLTGVRILVGVMASGIGCLGEGRLVLMGVIVRRFFWLWVFFTDLS